MVIERGFKAGKIQIQKLNCVVCDLCYLQLFYDYTLALLVTKPHRPLCMLSA